MSDIQLKITEHAKKHITHNQEKNQSKEADPEMTEIMKLANKDDIRAVINIVHIFKQEDDTGA